MHNTNEHPYATSDQELMAVVRESLKTLLWTLICMTRVFLPAAILAFVLSSCSN